MLHLRRSFDAVFTSSPLVVCLIFLRLHFAGAVICATCYDQIPGCPGGGSCKLGSTIAANRAALAAGTAVALTLAHLLPIKFLRVLSRSFLESIKAFRKKSAFGTSVDWDALSPVEVAQLPVKGLGARSDSILELQKRLGDATTQTETAKLTGLLNSLSQMSDFSGASDSKKETMLTGIYSFVWANGSKLVTHYGVLNTASLDVMHSDADMNGGAKRLTCVINHPKNVAEFYFALHVWSMILIAAGVDDSLVIHRFILEVVFENLNLRNWMWQVVYFYFLLQLEQVETVEGLNLANVVMRGALDTLKQEATDRADAHYHCIFRPKDPYKPQSGDAQPGASEVPWNGKWNKETKSICWAYNREKAKHSATSLSPDGTCLHRHVCDQWVTNKGPGGRCEGNHPRHKCDNTAKCDSKVLA